MRLPWILCCFTIAAAVPVKRDPSSGVFIIEKIDDDTLQDVCQTEHCREIAKNIIESRNGAVDPCDDFYEYACGSWSEHNPIPDSELDWSEDEKITRKTLEKLKALLEEEDKPTDIEPVKMVRQLYRSCMDVDAIEQAGIRPILDILNKTGGWPMAEPLDHWKLRKIRWQDIDKYYMTVLGSSAFFNLEFEHNENDTTRNILTIDTNVNHPVSNKKGDQELPLDFNDAYMNAIVRVAKMFAKEQDYVLNKRQLAQDVIDIVLFEIDLEMILDDERKTREFGREHVTFTIQELQEWYDSFGIDSPTAKIDFLELVRYTFRKGGVEISETEPIVFYNEMSLEKLAKLLGKTKERVIVNYIQWSMIHNIAFYANEDLRRIKYDIYSAKYNISAMPTRWMACAATIEMKDAASYLFVKRHVSDDVLSSVSEMVENIQEELEARINRSEWTESDMKMHMIDKLQNMVKQIGYPLWYNNETALIKEYEGLKIESSFFQNILNCLEHYLLKNIDEFKSRTNRDEEFLDFPLTVNAFYSEMSNAIVIPAAELQHPYFTESLPDAVNYGAVGFVIGHEMSHSFDNDGILHDKEGNKVSAISKDTLDAYESRAMCFADQFNSYTVDYDEFGEPLKIDGEITEDENIADSTGIQAAYAAYQKVKKKRRKLMKLPGLEDVSDDELFFLSFATAWCQSTREEYLAVSLQNDDHSPAKYRIIGSLANMEEFSKTFNCPPKSPMNREKKCSLWQ